MNTQFNSKGNAWRGSNPTRQLDGLSQPLTRPLESMDQAELRIQYEKTSVMLNNPNLKLPDGGAKLKAKLEKIDQLLSQKNVITDKVPLSDKIDIRKESLLRSSNTEVQPSNLLRAHHQNPADTDMDKKHSRSARMMSLDESMKLQESQQKDIKLANMRKKMESVRGTVANESLADDLTLSMNRLQLDPETRIPRPDDDGPSDGEGRDADSYDDTDSDDDEEEDLEEYERYDDEGFEEDQQEFEDDQLHNNNNRRV